MPMNPARLKTMIHPVQGPIWKPVRTEEKNTRIMSAKAGAALVWSRPMEPSRAVLLSGYRRAAKVTRTASAPRVPIERNPAAVLIKVSLRVVPGDNGTPVVRKQTSQRHAEKIWDSPAKQNPAASHPGAR
jgi:hypothetical protein